MNRPVSIYIHVPFCASKCVYCDFASYPDRNADWKAYFDALIAEIYSWREELERCEIQTVFFGGGTPTLVNAEYILRSMDLSSRSSSACAPSDSRFTPALQYCLSFRD